MRDGVEAGLARNRPVIGAPLPPGHPLPRFGADAGVSRAKRAVFGRQRGAEQTTPASLLAGDVPGTQPTTTSVVFGDARDDVEGRFGDSEHHHQEARIFEPPAPRCDGEVLASASVGASAGQAISSERVSLE